MIAERIRILRKDKDMSQKELAKSLGVSPSTIAMYEQGRRTPDSEMLKGISDFFEVSTDYLLGKTDIKEPRSLFDGPGVLTNPFKEDSNKDKFNSRGIFERELNNKDKKDIEKSLNKTMEMLESQEGLMLSGNPVDEEDWDLIKAAIQNGLEYAKKMNKQKYTPKKYRK